jgi:hypothetical protein
MVPPLKARSRPEMFDGHLAEHNGATERIKLIGYYHIDTLPAACLLIQKHRKQEALIRDSLDV